MSRGKARKGEAHVRLYRHEKETPAYTSLSCEARSLLIEFRALYNGRENRVRMSVREAERRLGVGRWRAQQAIRQLRDRGWVRVIEPGGFQRKTHHATVYALTNVPIDDHDGAVPPKDYMRWSQKSSVLVTSTDGVNDQHRSSESRPRNPPDGVNDQHRKAESDPPTVLVTNTQIGIPRGAGWGRRLLLYEHETQVAFLLALLVADAERCAA